MGLENLLYLKNESMNSSDVLLADSDAIFWLDV